MVKSLIFDLDQTLIDTSLAEQYRDLRQWPQVYSTIANFKIYDGLSDVFAYLKEYDYQICIVTRSPSIYCEKVLRHWDIPYHHKVCYHDVQKRKPDPESFIKALRLLKEEPKNVLSFGDSLIDIQASKAAGVPSVACLWGSTECKQIISANPEYIMRTPGDALSLLKSLN